MTRASRRWYSSDATSAQSFKARAGFGGVHVVGTGEQVAERLKTIAALGADGIVLSWVNYEEGITTWSREVMPRLEAEGLRRPLHRA